MLNSILKKKFRAQSVQTRAAPGGKDDGKRSYLVSKSSEVKGLPSQAEFVRQRLSEAIMTGELAPGSFLSEGQIADDFGFEFLQAMAS